MDCLDENSLAAFLERRSSAAGAQDVEAHIAECVACRQLLGAVAELYPADNEQGARTPLPMALAPTVQAEGVSDSALSSGSSAVNGGWVRACFSMADASRRVGTVLAGRWTLHKVLGVGGMGAVFGAVHRNGKQVAIKVLKPELAGDLEVVRRFVREGYAANRVGHEGAVTVMDDGATPDGLPFLVMEALQGETLAQRIERLGPLSTQEAARHADVVLDVLASAHALGIVHRDIKPANVFALDDGGTRLLDFGIAHVHDGLHASAGATQSGATLGTPAYMPPEQARGQFAEVDARSDVWAVGALLFMSLTGRPVHDGPSRAAQLYEAMTSRAQPIRRLRSDVPPAVAKVIDRALSFDRLKRWGSARAMQAALREACAGHVGESPPTPRSRPLGLRVAAGAAVAAALVVGVWRFVEPPAARPAAPAPSVTAVALSSAASPSPANAASAEPDLAEVPTMVAPATSAGRPEARVGARVHRSLPQSAASSAPRPPPALTASAAAVSPLPADLSRDMLSRHH